MWEIYCQLLAEKGVKSADVAREAGVEPSTFSDWKKGKSKPKAEKLKRIADYFGVTLEYLMGESEERTAIVNIELTAVEKALLSKFRTLSNSDKQRLIDSANYLLENPIYKKADIQDSEVG